MLDDTLLFNIEVVNTGLVSPGTLLVTYGIRLFLILTSDRGSEIFAIVHVSAIQPDSVMYQNIPFGPGLGRRYVCSCDNKLRDCLRGESGGRGLNGGVPLRSSIYRD